MKPKLQQKHPDSNHIAIKIKPSVFPEEVKNEESFITFRTNLEEANANLVHTIKLYQSRQKNQMSNDIEMKQISSTEDYAIDSISYVFSKYEKNDIPHELVVNIQDIMLNIIRIEHIIHDYKFDEIKKEYIKLNHELKSQIGQAESNYQKTTKIMHL